MAAPRISPQEVRQHKADDLGTVLVCAYDSEEKFRANHLDGAISLDAFQKQLGSISQDREIVFYWGWPEDKTAVSLAAKYQEQGYENAKILDGGVEAWKDADLPVLSS